MGRMSFFQDSILNNTKLYSFPDDDGDQSMFIKKYFAGKKTGVLSSSEVLSSSDNPEYGEEKLKEYNKYKNIIVNSLIDYNYLRYLNSNLSLAILAGIYL